jgi:hypothetical protein
MTRTSAFLTAASLTLGVAAGGMTLASLGDRTHRIPNELEVGESVVLPYHFDEEDTWEVDYSGNRVTLTRTR